MPACAPGPPLLVLVDPADPRKVVIDWPTARAMRAKKDLALQSADSKITDALTVIIK